VNLSMNAHVLAACLLLAGCATRPPDAVPPVSVAVAVSCVPAELAGAPQGLETRESLKAIKDPAERYVRIAADWAARFARMAETEPVVAACR
jgi:hypothetical protein